MHHRRHTGKLAPTQTRRKTTIEKSNKKREGGRQNKNKIAVEHANASPLTEALWEERHWLKSTAKDRSRSTSNSSSHARNASRNSRNSGSRRSTEKGAHKEKQQNGHHSEQFQEQQQQKQQQQQQKSKREFQPFNCSGCTLYNSSCLLYS